MSIVSASIHTSLLDIGRRQNLLIADDYVSYTAARDHHWNLTDTESSRLHQQFEAQHERAHEKLRSLLEPQNQYTSSSTIENNPPHE